MEVRTATPERVRITDSASPIYGEKATVLQRGDMGGVHVQLDRRPINWQSSACWLSANQVTTITGRE